MSAGCVNWKLFDDTLWGHCSQQNTCSSYSCCCCEWKYKHLACMCMFQHHHVILSKPPRPPRPPQPHDLACAIYGAWLNYTHTGQPLAVARIPKKTWLNWALSQDRFVFRTKPLWNIQKATFLWFTALLMLTALLSCLFLCSSLNPCLRLSFPLCVPH